MAANECMYFYEDEVYRVTKKGNLEFGMVLQNADVDSDEDHSDEEEWEKLKNGHILVAWHPRGQEDVIHEKKVGLSDRCLMPGDIVRRLVAGQDTQRGYCRSICMQATVQVVGTRQVIHNVSSQLLVPLEEFAPDIAVSLDAWVGVISAVTSEVELLFADGSAAVLTDEQAAELDDPSGRRLTDSEFRVWFYPGQRLTGPMRVFEPARWTACHPETQRLKEKRNRTARVTVTGYRVTSLTVHWQCRAVTADGSLEQPPFLITGDDLKRVRMLNVFEPCTLQLGDMNTYQLRPADLVLSLEEWKWLEKEGLKSSGSGRRATRTAATRARPLGPPAAVAPPSPAAVAPPTPTAGAPSAPAAVAPSAPAAGAPPAPAAVAPPAPAAAAQLTREVVQALPNGGPAGGEDELASVSSYSSVGSAGKRSRRGPSLKTSVMKKKKLKRSRAVRPPPLEMRSFSVGQELVVETVKTVSTVTVVWQDGSVEENLPSVSLHPSHHLDEHEFFPGDYVVQQGAATPSEYGVVQRVDHTARTAEVNWYQVYLLGTQPSPQLLRRSEVSVYDLADHPDFRYRPGTVVISVSPQSRTANSTQPGGEEAGTEREPDGDGGAIMAGPDQNGETAAAPPQGGGSAAATGEQQKGAPAGCTHAGQVLDVLPSGEVKVWWADGSSSSCYPQDLFRVGEYDSDEGELWDNNDSQSVESAEWETESEESILAGDASATPEEPEPEAALKPRLAGIIEKIGATVSRLEAIFAQYNQLQSPPVCKQLLEIYTNSRCLDRLMDTSFFEGKQLCDLVSKLRDGSASGGDAGSLSGTGTECGLLCAAIKAQLLLAYEEVVRRYGSAALADAGATTEASAVDPAAAQDAQAEASLCSPAEAASPCSPAEEATAGAAGTEDDAEDKGVAILSEEPSEHQYALSPLQSSELSATFLKAVRRDLSILRSSLPAGICVRGWESRLDLLSALVVGPQGTPYEDGLFVFDVQLGADYPRAPPRLHYHSYCQDRLNPNLYEDGKVCVSLLGTWGGRGSQVWSSSSSLLQVLVSVQGLILAAEPYYNEAGYERQRGSQQGRQNSRLYNERVLLKLVQSLTSQLRRPPAVFRAQVERHLRRRAGPLLTRLRHWMHAAEGAQDCQCGPQPEPAFPLLPASRGCQMALEGALTEFHKALVEHGLLESPSENGPETSTDTCADQPSCS